MSEPTRDPVERLAEEFLERHRRGERPDVEGWAEAHPELSAEIRELFPTLLLLENLGPDGSSDAGLAVSPVMPDLTERCIDDYRILREIGRGGMGIVYEAEQISLGRRVALKVLPSASTHDSARRERFEREARAAAQLHHPHIVPVHAVGETDGVPYYAMQLIAGQGLDQVLDEVRRLRALGVESGPAREGTSTTTATSAWHASESTYVRRVARIGHQVADALTHAHEQGILHRDIKPSNLLLDLEGRVWITDFGVAKVGEEDLTRPGDVVGTLRFMAPERLHGWADPRSDVFSLGLTLYEILTLRPAFDEKDRVRLVQRLAHERPELPRRIDPGIPRDLETIVLKASEPEPSHRYPSARALADDLLRFLNHEPIEARRVRSLGKLWRWCHRHRAVALLSFALLASLVGLAASATISAWRLGESLARAERAERRAEERLRSSYLEQASALRRRRGPGQRWESLRAIERAVALHVEKRLAEPERTRLRNEAAAALLLPDVQEVEHKATKGLTPYAFDATLRRFAGVDARGHIYVGSRDTQELIHLPIDDEVRDVRFAERHDALVVHHRDEGVSLWRLGSPPERRLHLDGFLALIQAPRGELIATWDPEGFVCFYTFSGERVARIDAPERPSAVFGRPGTNDVALAYGPLLNLRDLQTGARLRQFRVDEGAPWRVAWDPTEQLLAGASSNGDVSIWDLQARGRPWRTLHGHQAEIVQARFLPVGPHLLTASWDGTVRLWNVVSRQELLRMDFRTARLARDAQSLVTIDDEGLTWYALDLGEFWDVRLVHRGYKTPIGSCFSNDGAWIATWGGDGLFLHDATTRSPVAHLPIGEVSHAAFTPGDHQLVTATRAGLFVWPIDALEGLTRVGPPRSLGTSMARGGRIAFDVSKDARWLAMPGDASPVCLVDLASGEVATPLPGRRSGERVNLDPDARWLVVANDERHVFEVHARDSLSRVTELPLRGTYGNGAFSPDGAWFATTTDVELAVYETATWHCVHQHPRRDALRGPLAIDARSRYLAFCPTRFDIRLIELATGRELLSLESPDPQHLGDLAIAPDGSLLIAACPTHQLQTFHIGHLAEELTRRGLAPDPALLGAGEPPGSSVPPFVSVDVGSFPTEERRAETHLDARPHPSFRRDQIEETVTAYTELLERIRDDAGLHDDLAWMLVTYCDERARHELAFTHAERAVALAPENPTFSRTLGVAAYRLGKLDEARTHLERAIALDPSGGTAFDWLYLALVLAGCDEHAAAVDARLRAREWWRSHDVLSTDTADALRRLDAALGRLLSEG